MRLRTWTWESGRRDENLTYLTYLLPGKGGLWFPRECLLELGAGIMGGAMGGKLRDLWGALQQESHCPAGDEAGALDSEEWRER